MYSVNEKSLSDKWASHPTYVFHYLLHLNFIFYKLSSKYIKTLTVLYTVHTYKIDFFFSNAKT